MSKNIMLEAINSVSELEAKLRPLSELEIFRFMNGLRPGTFFNMGMYSLIPVSRAYKGSIFIYKVINMTAIVSGVDYENIKTTKDFRDRTGEQAKGAWYDHMPGYEHKVGIKKSDQTSKYVLWNIKEGSNNWVSFYIVDSIAGTVTPVSKEDLKNCPYLTPGEKKNLDAGERSKGVDKKTGQIIENQTNWRTAAFTHIFWLSQSGANTSEYGTRFVESNRAKRNKLKESDTAMFRDLNADVHTDLDAIFADKITEAVNNKKVIYVLTTFDGDEYIYDDFYDAVDMAENDLCTEARSIYPYYQEADGTYNTMLPDGDPNCLCWTEEEGILEEACKQNIIESNSAGFRDLNADVHTDLDAIFADKITRPNAEIRLNNKLKESYRRTVSRGASLVDNELFINFD